MWAVRVRAAVRQLTYFCQLQQSDREALHLFFRQLGAKWPMTKCLYRWDRAWLRAQVCCHGSVPSLPVEICIDLKWIEWCEGTERSWNRWLTLSCTWWTPPTSGSNENKRAHCYLQNTQKKRKAFLTIQCSAVQKKIIRPFLRINWI